MLKNSLPNVQLEALLRPTSAQSLLAHEVLCEHGHMPELVAELNLHLYRMRVNRALSPCFSLPQLSLFGYFFDVIRSTHTETGLPLDLVASIEVQIVPLFQQMVDARRG